MDRSMSLYSQCMKEVKHCCGQLKFNNSTAMVIWRVMIRKHTNLNFQLKPYYLIEVLTLKSPFFWCILEFLQFIHPPFLGYLVTLSHLEISFLLERRNKQVIVGGRPLNASYITEIFYERVITYNWIKRKIVKLLLKLL